MLMRTGCSPPGNAERRCGGAKPTPSLYQTFSRTLTGGLPVCRTDSGPTRKATWFAGRFDAAHALRIWGIVMTTFADREHSIEAHYALLGLAAFRERAHRYRRLGIRLAGLLNLRGADARLFARKLSEHCAEEPSDESFYHSMAEELARRGLVVSDADVRRMAVSGREIGGRALAVPPVSRSWAAFVTTELMALFSGGRAQEAGLRE
jgi:hypothetical protein